MKYPSNRRKGSPEFRFWRHVDKSNKCWTWTGYKTKLGYGRFNFGHEVGVILAHRAAFYLQYGYWPNVCMHICDNPPCVNPAHLKNGTIKENLQDMYKKGRSFEQNRKYCAKGHPFDELNTRWTKEGRRKCRTCAKLWMRIVRAKKKVSYA